MPDDEQTQGQTVTTQGPFFEGRVRGSVRDSARLLNKGKGFNAWDGKFNDGKWWIDPSGATNKAFKGMAKYAKGGHQLGDMAMDFTQGMMAGDYNPDAGGYRALLGMTDNDAFGGVVDTQAGKLADQITQQFGGAAFGSGGHSGTIVDQVGDFRNKMASDNWHKNNQMQRALLGDITGVEQMGTQNQMYGQSSAPGVYDFQYAPMERLAGVGAAREGYDAAKLQGKMDKFTAKDMADLNRQGWYHNMIGGGGNYGQTTNTVTAASNPWLGAGGGALMGSQIGAGFGGPLGAGLGAGAGALLGYLTQ